MSIKILPARLANQIAAGEVVERPASVVKELVENSIDSGATRIDIDIEKGGSKLIRVRDNGCGIVKDELGLALSRHATSKIHTLDDLEAIVSLGFRGEALASISSVSRLTMTSRPVTQEQAWSAYAEGRDMSVKLQPTAHPVGTTVEVLDLFFNTPARRKFLRTEKTEFAHIDELLKRIALSRFDVAITLRHNGKIIRQYRTAITPLQMEKRLAAVCGQGFVRSMLRIELEHQGLTLKGWITTPEGARQQSDLQYCYVNGRMMRDKLINHAIRQSYETSLRPDQYAAYVLYIDLDPHQVDVNVHPAKHEVRFHQARLVHDFIYQALASALAQSQDLPAPQTNSAAFATSAPSHSEQDVESTSVESTAPAGTIPERTKPERVPQALYQAIERTPAYPGKAGQSEDKVAERPLATGSARDWQESKPTRGASRGTDRYDDAAPSQREVRAYQELMKTPPQENAHHATSSASTSSVSVSAPASIATPSKAVSQESAAQRSEASEVVVTQLGKAACIVQQQYVLLTDKLQPLLLSLPRCEYYRTLGQLTPSEQGLKMQPLLVPLSLPLEPELLAVAQAQQARLQQFGIELKLRGEKSLLVMGVPAPLRQQNLQLLMPDLLSYLASISPTESPLRVSTISQWLAQRVAVAKTHYTLSEAIHLIAELENVWPAPLPLDDRQFVIPVDFAATIAQLTSS